MEIEKKEIKYGAYSITLFFRDGRVERLKQIPFVYRTANLSFEIRFGDFETKYKVEELVNNNQVSKLVVIENSENREMAIMVPRHCYGRGASDPEESTSVVLDVNGFVRCFLYKRCKIIKKIHQ